MMDMDSIGRMMFEGRGRKKWGNRRWEEGGVESRPQSHPPPSNHEASRDAAGKTRRVALSPVLEKEEKGVTHDTHDTAESLQAIRQVCVYLGLIEP